MGEMNNFGAIISSNSQWSWMDFDMVLDVFDEDHTHFVLST